jgi:glycosyltransferase involved in cell wall biosynthesis
MSRTGHGLKVGLNATCLNDRPSGAKQRFIGIYRELVKELPDARFVVYEPVDCRVGLWFGGASNVSVQSTPLHSEGRVSKLLGGFGYWPRTLSTERFDFFECFNQPLVKAPNGRKLLTIHDVRRIHPDWSGWERMAYKAALARDLRAADHVITVSHAMKEEILGFFPDASISVIYNGLETSEFDAVSEASLLAVRHKYQLPQTFVLAVGHFERRKNYLHLIDAMAHLRDRGGGCDLVIVGNDSGAGKAMREHVQSTNLIEQVQILSGLSDHEVRCVYRLCSLFVFPSSYEGFGIPILEAMAAGCPMALSDIPVFREITENRAVYFPHDDSGAMATAIERVLASSSERERQIKYGYDRVKDFNFKSLAGQLANLYRTLLNG